MTGLMLLFGVNVWAGEWTYTGSLNSARFNHAVATFFQYKADNERVLVTGGYNAGYLNSCELYDVVTNTWRVTTPMSVERNWHTATLIKDTWKVLVAGGYNSSGYLSSCEIFNRADRTWSSTGSMNVAREHHTATTYIDSGKGVGKVLVTGGKNLGEVLISCEVWDGTSWSAAWSMSTPRESHTATTLPNGNVFVAGGKNTSGWLSSCEIYDPAVNYWMISTATIHKGYHTATLLKDGNVLITRKSGACQLYDYVADAMNPTGSTNYGYRGESYTATLLQNGKVLIAGGADTSGICSSCELYDPTTQVWTTIESMNTVKAHHTATVLPSGKILVAGGIGQQGAINSCELYETSSPMRGGVAGRVTEEQTGYPIAEAEVCLFHLPYNYGDSAIICVDSDSNGNYEAEFELRADTDVVYAACYKTGYKGEWWDNKLAPGDADKIVVTNGQTHSGINFALEQGATSGISGIVCEAGEGISIYDASVSIYFSSDTSNRIGEAFSRQDGSYFIPLAPGSYYLRADKQGYESEWYYEGARQVVNVTSGYVTENINFTLASLQEGAISGMVMGEGDTVMPLHAYVELYTSPYDSSSIALQPTDQRGFYRFSQLKNGTYYVHIQHADGPSCPSYIREWWDNKKLPKNANAIVVTNKEVTGIDFYLTCAGSTEVGKVAGVVKDAVTRDPIKGAYVKIAGFNSGAYTDYYGKYLIRKVPVGVRQAVASAAGYIPSHSGSFEVRANELTENIDFLLMQDTSVTYGSISGWVNDSGGSGSDAFFVAVFPVNADYSVATVKTDQQRNYKVENLLPGKYHVRARAQGFQEQWFNWAETRDNATEVEVKTGQDTPNIYFLLYLEQGLNGGISGMVLDTLEQGISGARVWAQGGWNRYEVNTDNTGAYLIEDATFGLYKVGAYADGYKPGTYSEPVPVIPDTVTSGINIMLESMPPQDGIISGVVTDDSTRGIEKAMVVVIRHRPRFFGYAFTDVNGAYAVKNVPIGDGGFYVIAFALEYLPEFYDGVHSWRAATLVTPPATSIDFQLGHSRKGMMGISGRLTEAGKAGVPEAMIYAMDGEEIVGAAYSVDNGTYLLSQLPPGTYNLKISKPGYDDVTYGPVSVVDNNVSGADVEIPTIGAEENTTPEKQVLQLSVTPTVTNHNATIYYTLPEKTNAELSVYDVSGRKVVTLIKGRTDAGTHRAILNTSELTQGIYFVRLKGGKAQTIKKLIILQ